MAEAKVYIPRLKKLYREKVAPELFTELGYTSKMQVPRLVKVIVSMGVGEARENKKTSRCGSRRY